MDEARLARLAKELQALTQRLALAPYRADGPAVVQAAAARLVEMAAELREMLPE